MTETADQISNFMFGTKKPYDLGVQLRFRPDGIFTLRKPYESGFSRIQGNTERVIMHKRITSKNDIANTSLWHPLGKLLLDEPGFF